jgi:hypothetical protein
MRSLFRLGVLTVALAGCDSVGDDDLITRYSGPELTEADATVPNPPFGPAGWQGRGFLGYHERLVTLSRTTSCGDECARTVELQFRNGHDTDLPETARGRVTVEQVNPDGYNEIDLSIRRVEIQDWGPEVFSGVVYPEPADGVSADPIVFWADDLPTAVE